MSPQFQIIKDILLVYATITNPSKKGKTSRFKPHYIAIEERDPAGKKSDKTNSKGCQNEVCETVQAFSWTWKER